MLDDKVCEPFASSNHINLLPSAEKTFALYFSYMVKKEKKIIQGHLSMF